MTQQQLAPAAAGYRSPRTLAKLALVAGGLLCVSEITEGVFAFPASERYVQAARNQQPSIEFLTAYDLMAAVVVLMMILAWVFGCLWLWRARKNSELLPSGQPHVRSAGWVWAGWIVPFVCLWFPYQIVRDVRRRSLPAGRTNSFIGLWWGLWLAYVITTRIGSRLVPVSEVPEESLASALGFVEASNALIAILAFALWGAVVLTITREQEEIADRQAASATAGLLS